MVDPLKHSWIRIIIWISIKIEQFVACEMSHPQTIRKEFADNFLSISQTHKLSLSCNGKLFKNSNICIVIQITNKPKSPSASHASSKKISTTFIATSGVILWTTPTDKQRQKHTILVRV